MKRSPRSILSLVLCLLVSTGFSRDPIAGSTPFTYSDGINTIPYRLFRPIGWDAPNANFPVVLFLHGSGERGTDNAAQVRYAIQGLIDRTESGPYAAYLIAPQCPLNNAWGNVPNNATYSDPTLASPAITPWLRLTLKLVEQFVTFPGVDERRVYVTGLSAGGIGTFDAVSRRPDLFAAALPLSGIGNTASVAIQAFKNVPIWPHHGALDNIVLASGSREPIKAVESAGGSLERYTEIANQGHGPWSAIYDAQVFDFDTDYTGNYSANGTGDVYSWMFSKVSSTAPAYFLLVNKNSGGTIDLVDGGTGNGNPIRQRFYFYNSANQHWLLLPTEAGNHFKIISRVTGKCLCVQGDSTAPNALVHAWDYVPTNPSHQWDLVDAGNGWFKIKNVRSGHVLDVANFSIADNATLLQWNDTGTANQLFRLQPWGDYYLRTSANRKVCIENSGSTNGSRIIQYQFESNPWFKWRFESVGEGRLKVSSLNALARVLCVANASTTPGWGCHLWDYNVNNGGDQKVRLLPKTNGKYKFFFVHDNQVWDIPSGQTGNSVPLQQYPNNSNSWQDFALDRVP